MSSPAPESIVNEFVITLEQVEDFEFKVRFDQPQFPEWNLDEPGPLGKDAGPNAARVLAVAIGNCLSASFLFCARKARVAVGPIRTRVRMQIVRNERGRLRIYKAEVGIDPGIPEAERQKALRCLGVFEDYCLVTESVRHGIDVQVSIVGLSPGNASEQTPDEAVGKPTVRPEVTT